MRAVTYSAFRCDLRSYMRKTNEDADTILVTAKNPEDNIVVMSQRDYDSLMETQRIYDNPYLMDKLRGSMRQFREGGGTARDLTEDDDD